MRATRKEGCISRVCACCNCGIVKYLTKRHLNVNPSVKRWEMTGNPDKSRVVANLNGKK